MRSVLCVQSLHNFDDPHRHLLLMMDFNCPFETLVKVFVFRGRFFFLSLELVEIRLYLGASFCIYFFGS